MDYVGPRPTTAVKPWERECQKRYVRKYNFWRDIILGSLFVLLIFYKPTGNFDVS
jgi:hypothetical protein